MPIVFAAGALILVLVAVFVAILSTVLPTSSRACAPPPAHGAAADIPADYLRLYVQAGNRYGIGWHILAAVGKAESDHGRGPGSGIRYGTNHAGAAGPMQFLLSTWAAFGVDGDGDGRRNVHDPADAIPGAARYLKHNGAPERIRAALFAYNHSDAYVEKVLRQARAYAEAGSVKTGDDQMCLSAEGTVAAPTEAAAKAIAFARAQLGKPYVWGAEGPGAFDCSGLTYAAYRAAAITIPRVSGDQWRRGPRVPRGREQPGDLVFFDSGPGSSRSNPGHVGLVIAPGKMIAAPHSGTVVQVQSYERGTLLGFTRPTAHR